MKNLLLSTKMIRHTAVILLLVLVGACSDDSSEWNLWDFSEIYTEELDQESLFIGDYYQGGIIIALDDTRKHGLLAATEDQSSENPWWNGEFVQTNAVSTQDGRGNTQKILGAQGADKPYAAKLCADYQFDGYDDWFLPSKDQLRLLYESRELLDGQVNGLYWSSTEYETGSAWVHDFSTGEQHLNNTSDRAGVHTRAVREF